MTANLNARRLLDAYQSLAADGYAGGPEAFAELADLAAACLSNSTAEQRLPAMVLQNVFVRLSREWIWEDLASPPVCPVTPELHAALVFALKFIVTGGSPARCAQISEHLIRVSPIVGPDEP